MENHPNSKSSPKDGYPILWSGWKIHPLKIYISLGRFIHPMYTSNEHFVHALPVSAYCLHQYTYYTIWRVFEKTAILDFVFWSFHIIFLFVFIENTNSWIFQVNYQIPDVNSVQEVYKSNANLGKFTWQKWIKSLAVIQYGGPTGGGTSAWANTICWDMFPSHISSDQPRFNIMCNIDP